MVKNKVNGTLFSVPLPVGGFLTGRVVLDIDGAYKSRRLPHDSPLPRFGKTYLIEMYAAVTDIPQYVPSPLLIPGAYVESFQVGREWSIIGHKYVDPREVSFPESLSGYNRDEVYLAGEIRHKIPITQKERFQFDVALVRHSSFLWPYVCLRMMGRGDAVPENYKTATLEDTDLRYSPHRALIYKSLPFSLELSYFEKQSQLGLDISRLFE